MPTIRNQRCKFYQCFYEGLTLIEGMLVFGNASNGRSLDGMTPTQIQELIKKLVIESKYVPIVVKAFLLLTKEKWIVPIVKHVKPLKNLAPNLYVSNNARRSWCCKKMSKVTNEEILISLKIISRIIIFSSDISIDIHLVSGSSLYFSISNPIFSRIFSNTIFSSNNSFINNLHNNYLVAPSLH